MDTLAPGGFPRGTLITTDQGEVRIEHLDPAHHTINGEKIEEVVLAQPAPNAVVCFSKDAFKPGYPSAPTFMHPEHRVFYLGRMVPAGSFVGVRAGVGLLETCDRPLYNVVMPRHRMMLVNQLTVETALW